MTKCYLGNHRFLMGPFSLFALCSFICLSTISGQTYYSLSSGTFTQNWSSTSLLSTNDDWSGHPSIRGFLGQDITTSTGVNPQTLLGVSSVTGDLDVTVNRTNPLGAGTGATTVGGVVEFELTNPTIALAGSGTADAPYLVFYMNATGRQNIRFQCNLRDLEASGDNATQQIAIQYRIGNTGNFTDLPSAYVSDATTATAGPDIPISVTLPTACDNQAQIEIRVITTNAVGNDEYVGVDDISISSESGSSDSAPSVSSTSPANGATDVATNTTITINFSEVVNIPNAASFQVEAPSGLSVGFTTTTGSGSSFTITPSNPLPSSTQVTVTVIASAVTDVDANDPPDNMVNDYVFSFTTQGDPCLVPTLISAIQGTGATAALTGVKTIKGIVTGVFQGANELGGFYVQEEDADQDANPNTSEGIFINSTTPVNIGDKVCITGTAGETFQKTSLSSVTNLIVESTGNPLPTAIVLSMPFASANLEQYEGMRVTFPGKLVITGNETLGQFGEVLLTSDDLIPQFTEQNAPSVSGNTAALAAKALDQITLDDRRDGSNNTPIYHLSVNDASGTGSFLRAGSSVTGLSGIMDQAFSLYRIRPLAPVAFVAENPRPATPPSVGGNLKVANMNVLNYFNGPSFPTARGAASAAQFALQSAKIVQALKSLDADVVGLEELENDGYSEGSAIDGLVDSLNASIGSTTYAYVTNPLPGTDQIAVGIIYKPSKVSPTGTTANLNMPSSLFVGSNTSRVPLAQSFIHTYSGEVFTVVVNHFKSKGGTGSGLNADQNDGQGSWNYLRKLTADTISQWLTTDPTGVADPDFIILGDLNAYKKEDPIKALLNDGYVDLITSGFSYVFEGCWGSLDHMLASPGLAAKLSGSGKWAINAQESATAFEYGADFTTPTVLGTAEKDPYRSSDHNPLLSAFNLCPKEFASVTGDTFFCIGGKTQLTAQGAASYSWSTSATSASIEVNAVGTYYVTATDATGCVDVDTVIVTEFKKITASIDFLPFLCKDSTITLSSTIYGGTAPYIYSWAPTGGAGTVQITNNNDGNASAKGLGFGEVEISFTLQDANGCVLAEPIKRSLTVVDCASTVYKIDDPCICKSNGLFDEKVSVTSPHAGETWTVVAVSPLRTGGVSPGNVAVGNTLTYNNTTQKYGITFEHTDSSGYVLVIEGPNALASQGNTRLSIDNICYYPDVAITNLPAVISPNAAPFIVSGIAANNASGTGTFTLNGNTQPGAGPSPTLLTINPASLPPGTNTLTYSFDAGKAGSKNLNDPGCVKTVTKTFQIAQCGCQDVTVSLNEKCQFTLTAAMISDGGCASGTVRVMDNDPSNGGLIDCAGVWTYGLFDAFGNIICWGKVTAEDKTAPVLVCAPADITLDCYDVNYVLNNRLTIGNTNATSSPRPAASGPQTINNAEGVAGTGDNCQLGLIPPGLVSDNIKNLGYAYFKDNCYNCGCRINLKWSDKVEFYSCEQMKVNGGYYAVISREWTATDCNGMRSSYVQKIKFTRPAVDDFVFNGPGEGKYDRVVEYNSCTPDKSLIKKEDVTPYVCSYFNTSANPRCLFIDQVECNYSVSFKDTEFPICGGKGVKIDRELYVLDWCAGGIVDTFHILIKIGDFQAPSVEYAHGAPFDISTGPMDCTAAIPVSVVGIKTAFGVTIKDNCNLGNISVSVYTKDRYVKGILVSEGPANPICTRMADAGAELRGDNDAYRLGACKKENICWEKVEYAVMNGMMIGLPVGKHLMVIDAFDGCYNASTTCFVFEVKDKIAPIMKCDDDLHVTLSNANGYTNGYAQVSAADIDEGSWDNCKLDWIAVRRNVPAGCAASFIAKGYDTNNNGKLDALPADGDISKADGFDRNGDGDIADFGETFILKGGKLMTPLLDYVEFFCCDLSERVTVELWGGDIYGNTNYCWMDLLIEDKVAPTCLAPWDVTIYCDDKNIGSIDSKIASAKIFGDVTIPTGNDCAALDTTYTTEKKLKCGAGYIDRIWTLTKQTAKGPISVTCKQRIHILPVHEYNICFPKDVSTDCKTPIIDTVLTDELGCDILAVNISDKRYDASDDECYKIFRTYTVINWCTYDDRCGDPMAEGAVYVVDRGWLGNYGKAPIYVLVRDNLGGKRDGNEEFYLSKDLTARNADDSQFTPPYCEVAKEYYHSFMYTQIIKVYDDTRPVVSGIRDTFCTSPTACTANITKVVTLKDNCTDKVELETQFLMIAPFQTLEAGKMILYSTPRWSTKDLGNGQFEIKVSNLPEGTHDLIVVGRDECGNLSLPTRIPFVVKDCKAPAPICINGLSVDLMPDGNGGGMMTVWATDFVASKIYDCNGQGPETKDGLKLITKYSVNRVQQPVNPNQTSISVNCADLELGFILVELHAWDEAGNHDFCVTFVEVQDNRKVCPAPADKVKIAGTIATEGAGNLQGVSVTLSGSGTQNDMTGSDGNYEFVNISKGGDFTVTPQLDKNHLNGVSTFDLVLIQKHILGVQALNSPYKMIAADANNSKSISTLDLIQIRKLILNIDSHFANNTSWRFVDATYRFPNPTNPWSAPFPEVVSVNDLVTNVRANFVAIKVGDVNASASVSSALSAEIRTSEDFKVKTQEQNLKSGNEYKVSFSAEDLKNIQGYQFALNLDQSKVELLDIEYGVAKAENFGIFKSEGIITTSWNSKYEPGALFTLVLRAKANSKLSQSLSLNRLVHPEAYDQHNENLGIALNFEGIQANEAYELKQNTPNPFSDETLIGFTLPKAMKGTLTVRDVKGALVYKVEGNYAKGNNQVILKKSQLGASGVLYYTLQTMDFMSTKKMIILQ